MTNAPSRLRADTKVVVDISDLFAVVKAVRVQMVDAIGRLVASLEAAASSEAEIDFGGLVKISQQLLEMEDAELARVLNVSRPTIGRWTRGVSAPHALTRKAVCDELARTARAKMKLLAD